KCAAPCVGEMDETSYRKMAEEFCEFMEGKTNQIIERLNQEMESLSEAMEYEKAAEVRDKLQDIQKLTGKIRLVSATPRTQDLIALAVSGREACVQIFYLQDEQTVDRRIFLLDKIEDAGVEEILSSFLRQYYVSSPVPERVLIGTVPQDMESHRQWLESKRKDNKLDFFVPREGTKEHELIKLAENNARLSLKHRLARIERKKALTEGAVAELKNRLNLPTLPSHIEGFDISNIQGADAVGSMVFFLNGAPFRKGYRKFRIKEKQGRPDDVGMMREVVRRRYTRVLNEKKELPDLILIDGGKSQLNGAYDELEALGLDQIPIIGLAKQFEEIYLPGQKDPILLPQDSPALYLCQRIRDEAHRFAITYHKKLRTKRLSLSQLDEIPGIGGKRKKILLDHFGGSIENIRQASLEELETVPNLPKKVAEAVYVWFQEH
ncbi:MAG: excinuclease ABC subunit UvrC, partial [Promethearchaeota archaeon]